MACRRNNIIYIRKNLTWLGVKDFNCKDEKGNTPLYHAVACDNIDVAKYLLELGANIELRNEHGNTVLHKAMQVGDFYMIKMLIDNGADVWDFNDY